MGVRDGPRRISATPAEEQPAEIIEVSSISSASSVESLQQSLRSESRTEEKRCKRQLRGWLNRNTRQPRAEQFGRPITSRSSRKKQSAHNFLRELESVFECDEENDYNIDIYSFVEDTTTPFTKVVTNPQLLREWHEEFASTRANSRRNSVSYDMLPELNSRKLHPAAMSEEQRFHSISGSIRSKLPRRILRPLPTDQFDYEFLVPLEEELTDWFTAFPDSVMIKSLDDGFTRLWFHAVCQYYQLSSYSVNSPSAASGGEQLGPNAERKTYVQNNWDTFTAPKVPLSAYLSRFSS